MKKTVKEMFETAYKYAQVHGRIGIYDEDDIVQDAMLKMITRDPMPANSSWLARKNSAMSRGGSTALPTSEFSWN